MDRVCIATNQIKFIFEVVKVVIHGEEYDVHIHELGSWSINMDHLSSNNSDSDSKVDVESNNEEDYENEGDLRDLFQEEQVKTTENDKHDMEVNGSLSSDSSLQSKFCKCSTPFEKYRNKDIKGISVIHEMSRLIEVLLINMRGTKKRTKRMWIKEICYKNNIQFFGVQESKMTRIELFRINSMWGNYSFDYACSLSRGKWANCDEMFYMINIYGPQEKEEKFLVWNRLMEFIRNHEGQFVLFGDMNEFRDKSERYGTMFSRVEAHMFNSFIDDAGLLDLPLGGRLFTWMNKVGTKMSKLDRFLISNSVMDTFSDLKVIALPRIYSDHIPLMLHNAKVDYGPLPFKFFHSWLHRDGFEECIQAAYVECSLGDTCLTFHEKLKVIKQKLKAWNHMAKNNDFYCKQEVMLKLIEIEENIYNCSASHDDKLQRLNLLKEYDDLTNLDDMDTVQKARIKWDVEGDENLKFFHGILKQKRQ
ncbi:RNA-directed DNA polymerase, eukaryota, reverse transcriptase zinc-binding domain protein [Tanacetum coccineum]